jgi:hypothetical protein
VSAPGRSRRGELRAELAAWEESARHGDLTATRARLLRAIAAGHRARRPWRAAMLGMLVASLGATAFALWRPGPRPIELRPVGGPVLADGDVVAAPAGALARLEGSDGSRIALGPGARVALLERAPDRAALRLMSGGLTLTAPASPPVTWTIAAGPFAVDVTGGGTLQAVWDAQRETLSLVLGGPARAVVTGVCLATPTVLGADGRARLSCAPPRLATATSGGASEGSGGRPPAKIAALVADAQDDADLVAHFRFDEGAGARARDDSGHGHDATLWKPGRRTRFAPGHDGTALATDGGWATVPPSPALDALGDRFTLAAWIYRERDGLSFELVVSRQAGETHGERFGLGVFQNQAALLIETQPPDITLLDWGLVPNDRWVHLAATYDGRAARLYLDGQEVARRALATAVAPDDTPVLIGANANGPGRQVSEHFPGRIDDLRIYRRALSPEEIAGLAHRGP